jgi:flagellar biosynthesis/type III secretory pathway M-ring protein FliF/YscJ
MLASILDDASKAGTYPMQVLMLAAIMVLGAAIVYLHYDYKKLFKEFTRSMKDQDEAMNKERVDRIAMLMEVIREDTRTKVELRGAIENNTSTIERFETLLTKLIGTKVVL